MHTLEDDDVIRCVRFSPNDKFIATGCDNGSVKVRKLIILLLYAFF